jgi:hypothetical protein
MSQPQQMQLTVENCVKVLLQFVNVAQKHGVFELSEAEALVRSSNVVNGEADEQINKYQARQNLINGVVKGQKGGAYDLRDAASLNTVVNFLVQKTREELESEQASGQASGQASVSEDLSELSESVPLKSI